MSMLKAYAAKEILGLVFGFLKKKLNKKPKVQTPEPRPLEDGGRPDVQNAQKYFKRISQDVPFVDITYTNNRRIVYGAEEKAGC